MSQSPKLLEQVRERLRIKHYAFRTEVDLQAIRAKKPQRLPTVLTRAEVQRVLAQFT